MSTAKRGLGKGLAALLPGSEGVQELPLEQIRPAPDQPRQRFAEAELLELAVSIKKHGVLQPVIVRPVSGGYELVAGERRWRAAGMAGLRTIPALVREVGEGERLELALVENLQREDLNPLEEAAGYQQLLERFGYTQEELAEKVGKSRSHVANTLRLLGLDARVQAQVRSGQLTAGHARALLGVEDKEEQVRLARVLVQRGASVREVEEMVRRVKEKPRRVRPAADSNWVEWEQRLCRGLGTRVRIRGDEKRGRIEVEYYSREDLERLCELLAGELFHVK